MTNIVKLKISSGHQIWTISGEPTGAKKVGTISPTFFGDEYKYFGIYTKPIKEVENGTS